MKSRHSKTIRGTKKDAQRYLTKVQREHDLGEFVEPSDRPLADYLRDWLNSTAAARVAEKSAADYAALLRLHILPVLGGRKLLQLTAAEIQRVYNDMLARGLSSRTVRYVHSVIHSSLEQAVKWGMPTRNPAKHVELPRAQRREMKVLSVEQLTAFLEAAREDRWYTLWALLAATGLRPGEALGLKWGDIDGGRIHIQRNLVHQPGKWVLKEPKPTELGAPSPFRRRCSRP